MIPLPLPFHSPAWVNAYVIEGGDGLMLIDCGVDWEPGHTALLEGFARLGLEPNAVHTLVVSHLHPDHVGMAPRVVEELGCRLLMHRSAATNYKRYNDTPRLQRWIDEFGRINGVPSHLQHGFSDLPRPDFMPFIGPPDVVVDDGDRIAVDSQRHLEVLHTPGHEHSHICLRDSKTGILFSGDHILPRITPVIMWDETGLDVLGSYLVAVSRLVDLRIGMTYPAHGWLVERGSLRAEQILLHHERRLSGMEDVLAVGPLTAWDVMTHAYRPHLTSLEQRLALRETVSHLEHLAIDERVLSFEDEHMRWYRLS